MSKEEWRDVPGYDGLRASSLGRLWLPERTYKGRTYRTKPVVGCWAKNTGGGRYIIRTRFWGTIKVARMVCLAFHGEPPADKTYCLHIDENSANNRPSNLKWGTQRENLNAPGFLDYCSRRNLNGKTLPPVAGSGRSSVAPRSGLGRLGSVRGGLGASASSEEP
jgi:hypothetical protein